MLRAKQILAVGTILILMGVVKWGPGLLAKPKVSSVSILPAHTYTTKQYEYMADDIPNRLRQSLSTIPGVTIQRTPLPQEVGEADLDLVKLSTMVGGADLLVQPTVTLNADGTLELTLEAVDPVSHKVLFYDSFRNKAEQYPQIVQDAGAGLRKSILP